MPANAQPIPESPAEHRTLVVIATGVFAAVLVAIAWWMTGPAPRAADDGLPTTPPPLALPSDTTPRSELARAAAELSTGRLDDAHRRFVAAVAEHPDDAAGEVGLILSTWRSAGPRSAERDLTQLAAEHPDSAFVALHLGLTRLLIGDRRNGRIALRDAVRLGRTAADPTSLRMAVLGDDLLHPEAFRGYPPLLVTSQDVPPALRRSLQQLADAVARNDRERAARIATPLGRQGGMAAIAAAIATFDKDDADATRDTLRSLVATTAGNPDVQARARLELALATLWSGDSRTEACRMLEALGATSTPASTRRLSAPIERELCTSHAMS